MLVFDYPSKKNMRECVGQPLKYILRNWDINPKWDDIIVNYCSPIDESQEGGRRQLIEWLSEIVAEIEPRAAIHTETKIVF